MKNRMMEPPADGERRIQEVLARPYRKVISGGPSEGFLVEVPDLPGCMTAGATEAEALANLPEAMAVWLESALAAREPIPKPTPTPEAAYAGRLVLRVPGTLYRRLAERAAEEGVTLDQWAVAVLSQGG